MADHTVKTWERELLDDLPAPLRAAADLRLRDNLGPDPVLTKTDFTHIESALDALKSMFQEEYGGRIRKSTRSMWPFNDDSANLPPKFEQVFLYILKNALTGKTEDKVKRAIEKAGGRPYTKHDYGNNDYGDTVVQPDTKIIGTALGCDARTVQREIEKMVKVGVLKPLKSARNAKRMYAIGTLAV
ncbi:hypothetical protein [Paucidesulfovibrio longus]|uniref:hypothetical protein n=1 Tax=Paucidesulfovibrio longus TaxID=889 RepID=UPI0003B51593|nr:hypothetical protein [Paucidesulfovibrio longus]